jgi:aminomethyltransferase
LEESRGLRSESKRTPFHAIHRQLGAKIVEFAGFEMPIQYRGIIEEHRTVRSAVGVFDVSHMGEFEVWGKDAGGFVQRTTVNDVAKLFEGRVQYSAMCYDSGGIVDDLLVFDLGDHYLLVVNAASIQKDFSWLEEHRLGEVDLRNVSDDVALLAVQGPKSLATLQKLTSIDLSSIPYYHFQKDRLAEVNMIISRTGYTGELGFELFIPANVSSCEKVWNAIIDAGKEFGIQPVGLGARDTLRLEMGYCLYGNDIDQTTNPLEAGLGWITKLDKGDFIGRSALVQAKIEGLKRKLVGFTVDEKTFPRHGYDIRSDGSKIGRVTSGTFSPSLEKGIGMGYVQIQYSSVGSIVDVAVRTKDVRASIVKLPFLQRRGKVKDQNPNEN